MVLSQVFAVSPTGATLATATDDPASTDGTTSTGTAGLARTGARVVPIAAAGFGLVAVGVVLTQSVKKRKKPAAV